MSRLAGGLLPDAIAYGLFLIVALFVGVASFDAFPEISVTLADLLSGDLALATLDGASVKGTCLILLATATIAVPHVSKHRFAPLAFTIPLLSTILGFETLYDQHVAQREAMAAMADLGRIGVSAGDSGGGPFDSLGIGAYLLFAIVIFLAFRGLMRCMRRS